MFRVHRVWANSLSVRNLVLLFFTIVLGFASVITLAQITIPSVIDNAQQIIGRVTITQDGTENTPTYRDFNNDGNGATFISGLQNAWTFSWKVLWIDDNGYLVYTYSSNLVTSWGGGMGWSWDTYRTGNGSDIWNTNTSNVGIGTSIMSGKLHITSSAQTELYLEETNAGNAANINLKNTVNTWMLGWFSDRFYIGNNSFAFLNIMTWGNVGIGTTGPKATLQVVGNFIAGEYSNTITGTDSSIWWWDSNHLYGSWSFIWWGQTNSLQWDNSVIVWWGIKNQIINGNNSFIGGGWWWSATTNGNVINWADYSSIVWGYSNKIYNTQYGFIWGGESNSITWLSNDSVIPGWENNKIQDATNSFAAWIKAKIIGYTYTFVRNSDENNDFLAWRNNSFLISVPFVWGGQSPQGWVGINTNNPQAALDVSGDILWQSILWQSIRLTKDNAWTWCNAGNLGQIILSGTSFYGCAWGSGRKQLDN